MTALSVKTLNTPLRGGDGFDWGTALNQTISAFASKDEKSGTDGEKVDGKLLAKGTEMFTDNFLKDFSKKEQDNYNTNKVRKESDGLDPQQLGATIGTVAGLAICAAVGAPNPLCGVVGGVIGKLIGGLFSKPSFQLNAMEERVKNTWSFPLEYPSQYYDLQRIGKMMSLYGFENMNGVLDLAWCAKKRRYQTKWFVENDPDNWGQYKETEWLPWRGWTYSDCQKDPLACNRAILLLFAKEIMPDGTRPEDIADTDVSEGFLHWMNGIYETILPVSNVAGCVDQDVKTARGWSFLQMLKAGIKTPADVARYSYVYDDGQKDSHKQILDPCSTFSDEREYLLFKQRTGKTCPNRENQNGTGQGNNTKTGFDTNLLLSLATIGAGAYFGLKL